MAEPKRYSLKAERRPDKPDDLMVVLDELRVFRDVHYTSPRAPGRDWSMEKPLAADEFFLLGDNSPHSDDGRWWPAAGGLPRKMLVGRVFPAPATRYPVD